MLMVQSESRDLLMRSMSTFKSRHDIHFELVNAIVMGGLGVTR